MLELLEPSVRVRQSGARVRFERHAQSKEVLARQLERIIEREIGEGGQVVIVELAIAELARALRVVLHHRPQQVVPMAAHARFAVCTGMAEEGFTMLEVRVHQHAAALVQPLDLAHALLRAAFAAPARGKQTAKAIADVLDARQRDIIGVVFEGQQRDIDLVEEVQVDVLNSQR